MAEDRLANYRSKRDFTKTAEPDGLAHPGSDVPIFVVQKHAARALHYDFRIEVDGTLPSWAVPKGPSYDPKARRLAVHVEDHPLDYHDFEGTIPGGEYGGGAVIVWDNGTYRNISEKNGRAVPIRQAIESGHFSIWLDGSKLHGGWSFTRTAKPGDRQETWIMIKRKDEFADPTLDVTTSSPNSVKTNRTLEDVKNGEDEDSWTGGRATWVPPMLAELVKSAPVDGGQWTFERKFDGLRAMAVRNGDEVELWSRGHQPMGQRFAEIAGALARWPVDNFTIDGEVVAYDGDRTSFGLLQSAGSTAHAVYEVFDVLHLMGLDTRELPLIERRRFLAEVAEIGDDVHLVDPLAGDADTLWRMACDAGWEGLIAKRGDSPYVSGRSPDWRKLKCGAGQELVIGGFTEPRGQRRYFGALLVG
ncbi:MAG TPA: DNA polymerase ligase N-terminal domain-containing protein, partial [Acidimicrobiales bacterium]|nr:DNA polymerase ligase N-terminal domain-containing protein [Acidimicrobiales bacterium]